MVELTPKVIFGCGCFCTILITSICLFACSFGVVQLDEWAIVFDKNVQEIEGDHYNAGRYLIGLGRKFITFPRGLIYIESRTEDDSAQTDTLRCWTKDGINVYIEMNFYCYLNETQLKQMYFQVGEDWYGFLVRLSQTAVVETTTKYNTSEYFTSRQAVADAMKQRIQERMDQFLYSKIIEFNLRHLTFDSDFENAITNKLIQYQQKQTLLINQTTAQILTQTQFLEAQANNNITMIYADAQANGTILIANQSSLAFKFIIENEALLYQQLATTFGFNHSQLLQYIYVDALSQAVQNYNYFINPQNTLVDFSS